MCDHFLVYEQQNRLHDGRLLVTLFDPDSPANMIEHEYNLGPLDITALKPLFNDMNIAITHEWLEAVQSVTQDSPSLQQALENVKNALLMESF